MAYNLQPLYLNDDEVEHHLATYAQLKAERAVLEGQWQEVAELIDPTNVNSFQNQPQTAGEKKTGKQVDSTGAIALGRFVSVFDSLLTPHSQTWHGLTTDDPALNKNRQVQLFFEQLSKILFHNRYDHNSGFMNQNQLVWRSLGSYGTGALFIDQVWGTRGVRYKQIHVGELHFTTNHQGVPDGAYRGYRLTARQCMQKWGENCTVQMKDKAKTNPSAMFEIVHCVVPRYDYDPNRLDAKGMKWKSLEISCEGKALLDESGYKTFPYAISNYSGLLQSQYSSSPAMDTLPALKTSNEMKKTMLKQGHRITDPIYLVHDDGVLNAMSAFPGTVLSGGMSPEGRQMVGVLPTGNVNITRDLIEDERSDIKDAFLVSVFQILMETPRMTATEVMERTREKGILVAPTVGRQESYLARVINREIEILQMQGQIPPMPALLKMHGGQYKIRFDSPLSKMRQSEEAAGLLRMLDMTLNIANATQDPSVMYFYEWDEIIPDLANIQGLPARWIKTIDQVKAMRQAQAQANQTQTMIDAAPGTAALIDAMRPKVS